MSLKDFALSAVVSGVVAVLVLFGVNFGQVKDEAEKQLGAFAGPDITEAVFFYGGTVKGNGYATSTPLTSYTLVPNDVLRKNGVPYDVIEITPTVGDVTLTWFASSTAPYFLPKARMTAEQCIRNATTTAGIDITIAAGAGIDLETASTSINGGAPALTILADSTSCFRYTRKTATASAFDITMSFLRFADGD